MILKQRGLKSLTKAELLEEAEMQYSNYKAADARAARSADIAIKFTKEIRKVVEMAKRECERGYVKWNIEGKYVKTDSKFDLGYAHAMRITHNCINMAFNEVFDTYYEYITEEKLLEARQEGKSEC